MHETGYDVEAIEQEKDRERDAADRQTLREMGDRYSRRMRRGEIKPSLPRQRVNSTVLDGWLAELVGMQPCPQRRELKRRLQSALIGDGHKASAARIIVDRLIADRRRELICKARLRAARGRI